MKVKLKTNGFRRIIGTFLVLTLLISSVSTTQNASAAGNDVLPYGEYSIGSFTFTDTNLTPVKTVGSSGMLKFGVNWRVAKDDKGIGEIKLTVKVKNADTGQVLSSMVVKRENTDDGYYVYDETPAIYVTQGTRLRIWFDASSVGKSNGYYRRAYIQYFGSVIY